MNLCIDAMEEATCPKWSFLVRGIHSRSISNAANQYVVIIGYSLCVNRFCIGVVPTSFAPLFQINFHASKLCLAMSMLLAEKLAFVEERSAYAKSCASVAKKAYAKCLGLLCYSFLGHTPHGGVFSFSSTVHIQAQTINTQNRLLSMPFRAFIAGDDLNDPI